MNTKNLFRRKLLLAALSYPCCQFASRAQTVVKPNGLRQISPSDLREALKIQVEKTVIEGLPTPLVVSADVDVGPVQDFLARFGYARADDLQSGKLDSKTTAALEQFRKSYGLAPGGSFDDNVKKLMTGSRCGLPDPSPLAFKTIGPWDHKALTYSFGEMPSPKHGLNAANVEAAIERAMATWTEAGAGLTFSRVSNDPDLLISWKPAADPDLSMKGTIMAHADYPPKYSLVTAQRPIPVHFDDDEHKWTLNGVDGYDIETVALHELGHALGLDHEPAKSAVVMYPVYSGVRRKLHNDDVKGIRRLYEKVPS